MEKIIDGIYKHSLDCIDKDLYMVLDDNVGLIKDLYRRILVKEPKSIHTKTENYIVQTINKIFHRCFEKGKRTEAVEILLEVYEPILEHKFIYLEEELRIILKYISETEYLNDKFVKNVFKLLYISHKSIKDENRSQIDYIAQIYASLYYVIYNNLKILDYQKSNTMVRFISDIKYMDNTSKVNSVIELRVLKTMIDNKDIENFKRINKGKFINHEQDEFNITFILSIYLYYLIYKEDMVDGNRYKEFMEVDRMKNLPSYLYKFSILDNMEFWLKELNGWEVMPEGEVKWMIMDHVVLEFIFFTLCSLEDYDSFDKLNSEQVVSFILEIDETNNDYIRRYLDFKKSFGFIEYRSAEEELIEGATRIKKTYLKKEIEKYSESHEQLLCSSKRIEDYFNKSHSQLLFQNFPKNEQVEIDENVKTNLFIPTSALISKREVDRIAKEITRIVIRNVNYNTLHKFSYKAKVTVTSKKRKEKIDLLSRKLGEKYNMVITNMEINNFYFYREDKFKVEQYKKRATKINYVVNETFLNPLYWLATDASSLSYSFNNVSVLVRELSDIEIEEKLKRYTISDDVIAFPLFNGKEISLTRDEAVKYLLLIEKVLEIKVEYGLDLKDFNGELIYFN